MLLGVSCLSVAFYIFYFVRPGNSTYIVFVFIALVGLGTYFNLYRFGRKVAGLCSAFILSFLVMNYLAGFEIINTMLLISIIIGVALLM